MTVRPAGSDSQIAHSVEGSGSQPKSKEFSRVLQDKRQEEENKKHASSETLQVVPGSTLETFTTAQSTAAKFEEISGPPIGLAQLASLSDEITARLASVERPDAPVRVETRFDSRMLGGLEIHVSMERGELAIDLSAASPQTRGLLNRRSPELQSLLAERGYSVRSLHISTRATRSTR